MDPGVETVLRCYPQIYFACHCRHVRDDSAPRVLSAHQASILDHLDDVEGRLTGTGATTRLLANHLSAVVGRPVIDETGSDEQYDFKLEYAPELPIQGPPEGTPPPSDGPSIFTALTEQLGLRLEPRKGPVPVYVIERIEKPPEN